MGSPAARQWRRYKGQATCRLVRYADDFVILVSGTRTQAEALRDEAAGVLAPMGLRLSAEKTRVAHIEEASTSSGSASGGRGSAAPRASE